MGSEISVGRMVPGRFYRVSYTRGGRSTTVEGGYVGREVTTRGDDLVLAPMATRIHIPLSTVIRTVDVGLLLVDTPTDSRGVYTPMTRGRQANHAYVVTAGNQASLDILTQALAREWIDQPAVARRLELDPQRSSHLTLDGPGDNNEVDERVQHIHQLIEKSRARRRQMDRTLGRSL